MSESRYVVLLGFDRRKTVITLLGGAIAGLAGTLIGVSWMSRPRSGSASARAVILTAVSLFIVAACLALLLSNLAQKFAIVKANRSEIVLVYPFGLQKFIRSARMVVHVGDVVCLLEEGPHAGSLTEFRIRCGTEALTTRLGVSSFERDYAKAFAERAQALFGPMGAVS